MPESKSEILSKKVPHYVNEVSVEPRLHIVKKKSNVSNKNRRTSEEDLAMQGFSIGRTLGEGSFSKVKSATYEGKDIAVKIISKDQISLDFKSNFLPREIDVLSKISHKNLIQIYKIFSYPNRVYIFMEFIQCGTLAKFLWGRRLAEKEACYYFRQMVSAIQYLHLLSIAHRDLKCENIMITEDDEIKIIDFGFCRSTVNKSGRRELSETFCGTRSYAPPEILLGTPYNPMMYDVWSLGCILFIMLTGTFPFDDQNLARILNNQLRRQFRFPKSFTISKSGKSLISQMLEPDVIRRCNINQVAHSNWIQEEKDDFHSDNTLRADNTRAQTLLSNVILNNSVSRGTQTMSLNESDELDIFERRQERKGRTESARK